MSYNEKNTVNFVIPKSVEPDLALLDSEGATEALIQLKHWTPAQIEARARPAVTDTGVWWFVPIGGFEAVIRPLSVAEAASAGTASTSYLVGGIQRRQPMAAGAAAPE